jgi:hypothetical protein
MSKDELRELLRDPEIRAAIVEIITESLRKNAAIGSVIRQTIETSGGRFSVDRPMPITPFRYPRTIR